jgi:hypothetical protein
MNIGAPGRFSSRTGWPSAPDSVQIDLAVSTGRRPSDWWNQTGMISPLAAE